jgi:hypothetical protein
VRGIFDDGEQVLMSGVLRNNGFYRDQIRDQLDNRGISADQSASCETSTNHAKEKHQLQNDHSELEQYYVLM